VKPVLTATEYRKVDQAYEGDLGEAMERAGHAVALAAVRQGAGYGIRVAVLAGPGNNGGDGYVAARHLFRRGVAATVHRLGEPRTAEAMAAATSARADGVPVTEMGDPVACDLIVDAVFGGGSRDGLPDAVAAWSRTDRPVISVDFPTGLDPDTGRAGPDCFHAVETVTFSTLKTGHVSGDGPDRCGTVTVADIGIHGGRPVMWVAEEGDAPRPERPRRAHKWSAGAVLVAGGSEGMTGAAVMAARAALEFGAGAVYLASSRHESAHLMAPTVPTMPLEEALARLDRFDVVVAGPGLATADHSPVIELVERAAKVVLDAGALSPEIVDAALRDDGQVVVTPHAGEFKRLAGVGPGQYSTRSYARSHGLVVVAKGAPTKITDGGPPVLVTTGTQVLASIGTGDVLAGMIGALWARGLDPLTSAVSGTYWHGIAATELATSATMTAGRLLDGIGAWAW
jgi:ADP-dependent NAD(P)H-hydrate dehydratase / NAD(P)H-hydrate epimerase